MLEELRRQANAAAQAAFSARIDHHSRHGTWNPQLTREYRRLQMLVEMIDEHITLTQIEDLDAPLVEDESPDFPGAIPAQELRLMSDPGDHYARPS